MGLKDDLIKAKIESLKTTGVSPSSINASPGLNILFKIILGMLSLILP